MRIHGSFRRQDIQHLSAGNGEAPGTVVSKHTIAGGTGKYTGITGEWVGTRHPLRSPIEGQIMTVIVYKGSYKLP
jgi:hypothetical protein